MVVFRMQDTVVGDKVYGLIRRTAPSFSVSVRDGNLAWKNGSVYGGHFRLVRARTYGIVHFLIIV